MRPVVLLTDFGRADHYAGVLHAVLERDAPGVHRLDLSHEVAPGDIWGACFLLRCAWPSLPDDAIVLAVVDPGVGTGRRPLAVHIAGRWLVAPDNGLAAALGPADATVLLDPGLMGLAEPSATFHGRDLFAPAAARLARGDGPGAIGRPAGHGPLRPCPLPEPAPTADGWRGAVVHVDRFGNVVTNLAADRLPERLSVHAGGAVYRRRVRAYGEAPAAEVVLVAGSSGLLELAVDGGSAAEATGLDRGDDVTVVIG